MKILVTGGTGLVGCAFKSIEKNYPKYEFIFSKLLCGIDTLSILKKSFNLSFRRALPFSNNISFS